MAIAAAPTSPATRLSAALAFALASACATGVLVLQPADAAGELTSALRPLSGLSPTFFSQMITGLGAFAIAAWVWSLRPNDLTTRLFGLSGLATLTFTFSAAAWTEAAAPQPWTPAYVALNTLGASAFGIVTTALFLIYPLRLPSWRAIMAGQAGVFGLWTGLQMGGVAPGWSSVHVLTLMEMIAILAAVGAQILATAKAPSERAVAVWLGLCVILGAGTFIALVALPQSLGQAPLVDTRYAFLSFLLIYAGTAVGLLRYRLFELGDWAFTVLFYLLAALLLFVIDAMLIFVLPLNAQTALGLSIVIIALAYLPLRDALARRLLRRGRMDSQAMFQAVVDIVFEPSDARRETRWRRLMERVFEPLEISRAEPAPACPELEEDGLAIRLPETGDVPALQLRFPWRGRGLFTGRHLELAGDLITLMRHAEEGRSAYDRGVCEERGRIARDMHDNIGSQLLGALHSRGEEKKDLMIRETLSDLRDIINNVSGAGLSLEETLADLRAETAERVAAAGVRLDWSVQAGDGLELTPGAAHALRSIVREAASNVIRHAGASQMSVRFTLSAHAARLQIQDDGCGFDPDAPGGGNGVSNMRARIASLGGEIAFERARRGARLVARLPRERIGAQG